MQMTLFEHMHNIKIGRINKDVGIRVDSWSGSPLGNPYYREPRETSIPKYRQWLWSKLQDPNSKQIQELKRLIEIYKNEHQLRLLCWCAPRPCHAEVVKRALEWMMAVSK